MRFFSHKNERRKDDFFSYKQLSYLILLLSLPTECKFRYPVAKSVIISAFIAPSLLSITLTDNKI